MDQILVVFFSSSLIASKQHGCLGEPQYLPGTSARPRHRLLLRHAVAGGKLAAGMCLNFYPTTPLLSQINGTII